MSHPQVIDLLVEVALAVDPRVEIRAYTPRGIARHALVPPPEHEHEHEHEETA